jgi:hypothetical protein
MRLSTPDLASSKALSGPIVERKPLHPELLEN